MAASFLKAASDGVPRRYRRALQREAAASGLPLARPLALAYPDDAAAWNVSDAFLLGDELFVAPVFCARDAQTKRESCDETRRDVPLVAGSGVWVPLFGDAPPVDCADPKTPCALANASAPLGAPLVFANARGAYFGLFEACARL